MKGKKMGTIEEAREIFANDRYATVLSGAYIEKIGENYAKCSMRITDDHRNAYGGVMGGSIYTLADFAFAVASNYDKEYATVSVVGQASFMAASKGSILYAEAKLLKDGRNTCFYDVTITDDQDKLIAVVNFSGQHVPRK
jgi:acyl-CoA thioesterase